MDTHDDVVTAELERLAQAHTFDDSTSTPLPPSSELMNDLGISKEVATSVLSAQRFLFVAEGKNAAKIPTALVTVPADHPADYLLRLDPPIETTAKLEPSLGLPAGVLQSVKGGRLGGREEDEEEEEEQEEGFVGQVVETVQFCFVTLALRERILAWVEMDGDGFQPMWVKLAKV